MSGAEYEQLREAIVERFGDHQDKRITVFDVAPASKLFSSAMLDTDLRRGIRSGSRSRSASNTVVDWDSGTFTGMSKADQACFHDSRADVVVLRDGAPVLLPAREVCVGDVILLAPQDAPGWVLCADVAVLPGSLVDPVSALIPAATGFVIRANMAHLTGENDDVRTGERTGQVLFAGANFTSMEKSDSGSGGAESFVKLVVLAVGCKTFLGEMCAKFPSHDETKLNGFGRHVATTATSGMRLLPRWLSVNPDTKTTAKSVASCKVLLFDEEVILERRRQVSAVLFFPPRGNNNSNADANARGDDKLKSLEATVAASGKPSLPACCPAMRP